MPDTPERRGGRRPNAGRKPKPPEERTEQRAVSLLPRQWRRAEQLGETASQGIAKLLDEQ